jgi:hypothetical protein
LTVLSFAALNWLTVVLALTTLSDGVLGHVLPFTAPARLEAWPAFYAPFTWSLVGMTLVLSIKPVLNLFSKDQAMNRSYNSIHLINTYGAFGSVSKERMEVVVEGSEAEDRADPSGWREYEFKGKPGDVRRCPSQVAPYHLRLDWMMWFLQFGAAVSIPGYYEAWFVRLAGKLLEADRGVLRLLRRDPFEGRRPKFVRARMFRYEYTTFRERRLSKAWWKRTLIDDYLPPISADELARGDLR